MPIPSKFPGYDLILPEESFLVGDYYYALNYRNLIPLGFNISNWGYVDASKGPRFIGQTFAARHGTDGYTVIRKNNNWKPMQRRLALSRIGSRPLPLP
jgi:hypothetical protein